MAFAERLTTLVRPITPLDHHALVTVQAQLAEAAGDHAAATGLYADAAERWEDFGYIAERAYALRCQGRCLRTLGDPAANAPLTPGTATATFRAADSSATCG